MTGTTNPLAWIILWIESGEFPDVADSALCGPLKTPSGIKNDYFLIRV
jgi:hypothetical protein